MLRSDKVLSNLFDIIDIFRLSCRYKSDMLQMVWLKIVFEKRDKLTKTNFSKCHHVIWFSIVSRHLRQMGDMRFSWRDCEIGLSSSTEIYRIGRLQQIPNLHLRWKNIPFDVFPQFHCHIRKLYQCCSRSRLRNFMR